MIPNFSFSGINIGEQRAKEKRNEEEEFRTITRIK